MFSSKMIKQIPQFTHLYRWTQTRINAWNYCFARGIKVAIVGAAGGIGQPLSLLLKQNPQITQLAIQDLVNTKGIAADLSHISTTTSVCSYTGKEELIAALEHAGIVIVAAGLPRKPGMNRSDLLSANGGVAVEVARAVSKACPAAMVAFITNPVNTVVPIAAEVLKKEDAFDPNRLFGVTSLDVVRAQTFIGEALGVCPKEVNLPVIGGHAGLTILPVFSKCKPEYKVNDEQRKKMLTRIQEAGTEVVKAKAGTGSATLSMAYAAANFVNSLLRAMNNEENVIECAYVASDVSEAEYFATQLLLGPKGIKENLGIPELNETEEEALEALVKTLLKDIAEGVKYADCE
ncbi:malate dehydrogenase, mitochondrial-like [Drosophila montana]|uniref:malate dehydrogenase, mitochondrial-like n=1 Tax=Drosophila montana TaxID=40370 RepID=UPI00313E49C8